MSVTGRLTQGRMKPRVDLALADAAFVGHDEPRPRVLNVLQVPHMPRVRQEDGSGSPCCF